MLSLLANAKLVLGSVFALVAGTFFIIFKARGEEINVLKDDIEHLKEEARVDSVTHVVTEEVTEMYTEEEKAIVEDFEDKIEYITYSPNKPLAPSLLDKLRNIDGLQDKADRSPE